MNLQRCLILSDIHIPFHHKVACDNVLSMIDEHEFRSIALNGDTLDCYSISRFDKAPKMPTLNDELVIARAFMDDIEHATSDHRCYKYWLDGNHEDRLYRERTKNPGLYDLPDLDFDQLLKMNTGGWYYARYMIPVRIGNLTLVHGNRVSKHAGYTAKATLLDGGYKNVAIGHTHRQGVYKHTGDEGTRRGYELGGLWDKSQAGYLSNPNWQGGFGVAYFNNGKLIDLHLIEVSDEGSFIFEGTYYDG